MIGKRRTFGLRLCVRTTSVRESVDDRWEVLVFSPMGCQGRSSYVISNVDGV